MGELLLDFFRTAEQSIKNPVYPNLTGILGAYFFSDIIAVEGMLLFDEETKRAFHKLSFHCDVSSLLKKVENEKILFLGMDTAYTMIGSEQFYTRLLTRQTGCEVEIHQKHLKDINPGLLIKVVILKFKNINFNVNLNVIK